MITQLDWNDQTPLLGLSQGLSQSVLTMHDLPSEDPKESGLPDEFHDLQPQLLSRTLQLNHYARDRWFTGSDLNLYYDAQHPRWHKRPDWFLVVDVPRLYQEQELRSSFVVWDEQKAPTVIVELLSPGREAEDLGSHLDEQIEPALSEPLLPYTLEADESGVSPPPKWDVYEQILQVPYYLVFSRYSNRLRFFQFDYGQYQEQVLEPDNSRAWLANLEIGIGIWQGEFEGITRAWLRWFDREGNWILTDTERERQRAEIAETKAKALMQRLKELGLEP